MVCAGAMKLERRLEDFVGVDQQVEAVEDAGRFLEGEQRFRGRLQLVVEDRRGVERRDAGVQRFGDHRRGFAQRLGARLQRGEEAFGVFEEGVDRRQVGVDRVERRRAFFDRFLDVGAGDAGEGGEGAVEGDEQAGLGLGDRGDRRREGLERPPEAGEVGARARPACAATGWPFSTRPPQRAEALRSAAARGRRRRCRSRPGSGGSRRGSVRRTC